MGVQSPTEIKAFGGWQRCADENVAQKCDAHLAVNNAEALLSFYKRKGEITMDKYFCNPCGYTYDPEKGDPEHGIKPGTAFEDLPDDWCCPICGVTKDMFMRVIQ